MIDVPDSKQPVYDRVLRTVKTLRWWALLPVPIVVLLVNAMVLSGTQSVALPEGFREVFGWLLWVSRAAVLMAIAHGARRLIFPTSDSSASWQAGMGGNVGAAILNVGVKVFVAMVFLGLVNIAKAQDARTYVPENAKPLLPQLRQMQETAWPGFVFPSYFGALIEQESCISLKHSRCWNSAARLKTEREEGGGLGQITRAYTAAGALRFDAIAEVRRLDPVGLADFSWATVYTRADLSMRAVIVKVHDCATRLSAQIPGATPYNLLAFCDAAYNGGSGGLTQDRTICAVTPACDPNRWFGQVERTSAKSRTKWQGYGKSAFEINREHVYNALVLRRPKYMAALGADLV